MQYLKNINWSEIWPIIKEYVLPHSGRLIFNAIIFLILGIAVAIIYLIVIQKKGVLKRKPKYYNWVVKLYYPLVVLGFAYISVQIGLLRGAYKILLSEKQNITLNIYDSTVNLIFDSEENKNKFIVTLQETAKNIQNTSKNFTKDLQKKVQEKSTGNSFVDKGKNMASKYLIKKYGDDIFKNVLYGIILSAGKHINITESLPYEEYSSAMDFLLEVEHTKIEKSIKNKLEERYKNLLTNYYKSIVNSLLIFLLLFASIPFLEHFIYKKWIEPKYINKF